MGFLFLRVLHFTVFSVSVNDHFCHVMSLSPKGTVTNTKHVINAVTQDLSTVLLKSGTLS